MFRLPGSIARIAFAVCLVLMTSDGIAQQRRTTGKPRKPTVPALKTSAEKMKVLEGIRNSMVERRQSRIPSYSSEDLDKGLERSIGLTESSYAPLVDDERFLRRAYLDLTGQLPPNRVLRQFVADKSAGKRGKVINGLLNSAEYSRHWAQYWRDVVFHDSPANKNRVNPKAFEDWLAKQLASNTPWDRTVAEMVSATPKYNKAQKDNDNAWNQKYGPNNFVLAYENKPEEIASQTARIFMGISVQCAECHDHPFDRWKREQFHEMAAFFARGTYKMPDQDDPSKEYTVKARFLLGETPPKNFKPDHLRVAVAAYLIYNPKNYWFARAYVNRVWNELMGDGFYSVDSLGPDQECLHQLVVNRLAAMFRYKNFDSRWLIRTIMNSRSYQRDIRSINDDAEMFTAVRPSRLRSNQIRASVERLTGKNENIGRQIDRVFDVDPSIPQSDLEGSIQQALLMMNNGTLQQKLRTSELKKRLLSTTGNHAMLDDLYISVLARLPTESERSRNVAYLKRVTNRDLAIDDLIWVLVNTTEFVTKR